MGGGWSARAAPTDFVRGKPCSLWSTNYMSLSILAWRIPWTEEPGRLRFTGSQRVGHDLVTKQQHHISVQFSSVTQSCPTLCNPMNCSMPGLLVHYQLPEFTQTHVHRVSDAIQPSHPLSSLSPPTFNLSQHQGLFQ